MNKRIASAILWLYAGWTFGALIAMVLGVSDLLGPIIGVAASILFVGDPQQIIWARHSEVPQSTN